MQPQHPKKKRVTLKLDTEPCIPELLHLSSQDCDETNRFYRDINYDNCVVMSNTGDITRDYALEQRRIFIAAIRSSN